MRLFPTADGTLRLYDGSSENEGLLEIFHENRWGFVIMIGTQQIVKLLVNKWV